MNRILMLAATLLVLATPAAAQTVSLPDALRAQAERYLQPQRPVAVLVPPAARACPQTPDPSVVYGYFALIDPRSGQTHVPYSADYGRVTALGYPTWSALFRSRADWNQTSEVLFAAGGLTSVDPDRDGYPNALRYELTLNADRRAGNPVRSVGGAVTYNPDLWCFGEIRNENYGPPFNAMRPRADPIPGLPGL